MTVLATSRQVPKFPAWKSAIALRIMENASDQIWPVVTVAILVIAFLKVAYMFRGFEMVSHSSYFMETVKRL